MFREKKFLKKFGGINYCLYICPMVQRFRKKPVIIEAEQFDGKNNPFDAVKEHQCDYRMCPLCGGDGQKHKYINTMHDGQSVILAVGDWVIPDGKPNTFYPCKPDIFEKTYELV